MKVEQEKCPLCGADKTKGLQFTMVCGTSVCDGVVQNVGYCCLERQLAAMTTRAEKAEAIVAEVFRMATDAPEINMSNYDEEQVSELNEVMIAIYLFIKDEAAEAAKLARSEK